MAKIRTVLGDIAPEDAGVTLTHEHIRYAYPGCEHDHRNVWDFDTVADEVGKIESSLVLGSEAGLQRELIESSPVVAGGGAQDAGLGRVGIGEVGEAG